MITRWKNGVPNTRNNLRDDPLNPRLDIGKTPFKTLASFSLSVQKKQNSHIYNRGRAARQGPAPRATWTDPTALSSGVWAPRATCIARPCFFTIFCTLLHFDHVISRQLLTISTLPLNSWWCQLPINHHAALSNLITPHLLWTPKWTASYSQRNTCLQLSLEF